MAKPNTPTAAQERYRIKLSDAPASGSWYIRGTADLALQTPRLGTDGLPVLSGGKLVYDFFQDNDIHTLGVVGGGYARFGNRFYIQPEPLLFPPEAILVILSSVVFRAPDGLNAPAQTSGNSPEPIARLWREGRR